MCEKVQVLRHCSFCSGCVQHDLYVDLHLPFLVFSFYGVILDNGQAIKSCMHLFYRTRIVCFLLEEKEME